MRKRTTFIATTLTLIATLLFGGCGSKRETSTAEVTYVTQDELIETLNNRDDVHQREIKELKKEVETLSSKLNKQQQELSKANERIAQLEGKVPEAQPQVEPQETGKMEMEILMLYRGKVTKINAKDETDAINHPIDIYEGVAERNVSFIISGTVVKNIYANQIKIEDVAYNVNKQYSFTYYMPGEGQYTFLIETKEGNSYFSVKY